MIISYLQKAVTSDSIQVVSFDFFDTLVWRNYQKPVDLFLELGCTLKEQGILASPRSPDAFALLRIEAERKARQDQVSANGSTEVSLQKIYDAFPDYAFSVDSSEVLQYELELEGASLIVDRNLVDTLEASLSQGHYFVICSDTYFSSEQLRSLMRKCGMPNSIFTKIFASSEYGISKSEGLIAKVLSSCEVEPSQLLHIGDHPYKDGHSAKMVGATYMRYPEVSEYGEFAEERFAQMSLMQSSTKPFGKSDGGIFGLSRRFRSLVSHYPSGSLETDIVSYGYGPLFCGFAEWIGTEVSKFKPHVVSCPTREGLFLSKYFNCYFEKAGLDVEARNFLTSRAALSKGSFFTGNFQEVEKYILGRRLPLTFRKFASIFELDLSIFPIDIQHLDYPLRSNCNLSRELLKRVSSSEEFRSLLVAKSAEIREGIISYFENYFLGEKYSKALAEEEFRILVADVGWTGSSQRILEKILKTRHPNVKVRGRYLMLDDGCIKNILAGTELEGWLINVGEVTDFGNVIIPCKELLEQLLMADMPSVIGYSSNGTAILFDGSVSTPVFQKIQIKRLQNLTIDFLNHYWEFREKSNTNIDKSTNCVDLRQQESFFRTHLAAQTYRPQAKELEMFKQWEHEDNDTAFVTEKLINGIDGNIFQYATLRQAFNTPSYWHLGNFQAYKNPLSDRAFMQQYLGEYGIHDVYEQRKASYQFVDSDGLSESEAVEVFAELSESQTAIVVCHGFTEVPAKIRCTNLSHQNFKLEKILLETYDSKKFIVDASILEATSDRCVSRTQDLLQENHEICPPGWTVHIDLTDVSANSSYEINTILCIRYV